MLNLKSTNSPEAPNEKRHLSKSELYQFYSGLDDFTYPRRKMMQAHLESCKECAEEYRKIVKEMVDLRIGNPDDPIRFYR